MSSMVWLVPVAKTGLRMLRSPREIPAMALALAVGVGLTVVAYSLVRAALFVPLPYNRPERLAQVWVVTDEHAASRVLPEAAVPALTGPSSPFRGIATYTVTRQFFQRVPGRAPIELGGALVSTNLFDVLGVMPDRGRTLEPADALATDTIPIIVSARLIQSGVVSGRLDELLPLGGATYRVAGVMPDDFWFPDRQTSYWLPLRTLTPGSEDDNAQATTETAGSRWLPAIGRLSEDATWETARAQTAAFTSGPGKPYPGGVRIGSYAELLAAPVRPALLVLQAAAGLVLLSVCLNVGWLFAARARRFLPAFAAMRALGAGTGQVVATHLVSALCVAAVAIPGAVLIAWTLLRFVLTLESGVFSGSAEPAITWHVLVVAVLVTVLATVGACLPSAWMVARRKAHLGDTSRTATRDGHWEHALMAGQVGLVFAASAQAVFVALVLLSLSQANVGIRKTDFVVVSLGMRGEATLDPQEQLERYKRLLQQLDHRGIQAAVSNIFPLTRSDFTTTFEPRRSREHRRAPVRFRVVTPSYFAVTGLTALSGRLLTAADAGSQSLVVTDAFSASVMRGRQPIGAPIGNRGEWTIVGVTPPMRQFAIHEEALPEAYALYDDFVLAHPGASSQLRRAELLAETSLGVATTLGIIRAEVAQTLPDIEIQSEAHVSDLINLSLGVNRLVTAGSIAFAAAALLLAAIGLYAMVSHALHRRRRELGVRMALGATASRIVFESGHAIAVVYVAGLCVGLGGLLFGHSAIQSVMVPPPSVAYPSMLAVAGTAAGILLVTVTVACYGPLKRAAGTDPVESLRLE